MRVVFSVSQRRAALNYASGFAEGKPQRSLLQKIGPGVISGAANDDPSCIVTYSMAGAALSYMMLWTSLFGLPLLAAVQSMCARLGMVSGHGLAGALRKHYPTMDFVRHLRALGAEMVTGVPALACTLIYSVSLAYLGAGLLVRANWGEVVVWTLLPRIRWSKESLSVIVAIIGASR